eukprot:449640_1
MEENKIEQKCELKENNENNTVIKTIKLSSGYELPLFGYGTSWRYGINAYWGGYQNIIFENKMGSTQNTEQEKLEKCIVTAIKNGYKCIDSAQGYSTEQIIGNILKNKHKYKILRKDIFITTKLGSKERTITQCEKSIKQSLKLLHTDYIDLYLIHSPHTNNNGMDIIKMYKYLLDEYKSKGIIRSVGVSNFGLKHIKCLKLYNLELPTVNQIAFSCFMNKKELIKYCIDNSIVIQGYAPLCKASYKVITNNVLLDIAKKYSKTWSDICLKYCYQKNIAIIVQSKKEARIKQNIKTYFDKQFVLSNKDMIQLDGLNKYQLEVAWGNDPTTIKWDIFNQLKD